MTTWPRRFIGRLAPAMPILIAMVGALTIGGTIMLALGFDPRAAYGAMIEGAFGGRGSANLVATLNRAAPIAGLALAISLALRAGLLNLGAEGQLVVGALAAAVVAPHLPSMPGLLAVPSALAVGALAGGAFARLASTLAVRWAVPLLVGTLLLNYPARYGAAYLVGHPLRDVASGLAQSHRIPEPVMLPLLDGRLDVTILLVLVATALASWWIAATRGGLTLRLAGHNEAFSRYLGVDLSRLSHRVMWASGGAAGAVGAAAVLAVHHRFIDGALTRPGYAWTALMAALLAGARPWPAFAASLLFAAIQTGGFGMERHAGVPRELSQVLQALIILLVAAAGYATLGRRSKDGA